MDSLPPVTRWLREEKARQKVSLRHIAKFAHLSTNTVKNLLDGTVERPTPETIASLATYFRVSCDELMARAGYVSAVPRMTPEEQAKIDRDRLIESLLLDKTPQQKLALVPEDVREDVSLSFRRVPTMRETYDRIIDAFVRDWLSDQPDETLERLSNQR